MLSASRAGAELSREPDAPPRAIVTSADAARWLTYYYVWPTPDLTVPAFRRLAGGLRPTTRPSVAMFFAQVFRGNASHIVDWARTLRTDSADQTLLAWTLWYSDTDEGRRLLESLPPSTRADIPSRGGPPDPRILPLDSAAALDLVWAAFFATGDHELLRRLALLLPDADDPAATPEEQRVATAARWSLLGAAVHHQRVLAYCDRAAWMPPDVQRALRSIAAQARTDRAAAARPSSPPPSGP